MTPPPMPSSRSHGSEEGAGVMIRRRLLTHGALAVAAILWALGLPLWLAPVALTQWRGALLLSSVLHPCMARTGARSFNSCTRCPECAACTVRHAGSGA